MQPFFVVLLLGLIIISNIINKKLPGVSIPLIQIGIGVIIGIFFGVAIQLDTHLFMLIFIAPILFADGEKISNKSLLKYKSPIAVLACGLVFATVLICGAVTHIMIPLIPFAACFALAAVLSPTDALAVASISNRVKLPTDLKLMISGESLMNDATGLVMFDFAVAAALTGNFSIGEATLRFFYVALGGIAFGTVGTYIIKFLTNKLKNIGVEDATAFTLIHMLTPFIIYYFASMIGISAVLAVVFSGIVQSIQPNRILSTQDANIKLISDGAWSTLLFSLNGLIYLMLGIQLPAAMKSALTNDQLSTPNLILYIFAVIAIIAVVRFAVSFMILKKCEGNRWRNSLISTLCGARGAITLAACLSIPLFLDDGTLFPQRDLLLFISSGVIIVTLLLANFILPLITPKPTHDNLEAVKSANKQILNKVIDQLRNEINEKNRIVTYAVISHYENLLAERRPQDKAPAQPRPSSKRGAELHEILQIGLKAELDALERLTWDGNHNAQALNRASELIDMARWRLTKHSPAAEIKHGLRWLFRRVTRAADEEIAKIRIITIKAAIKAIEMHIDDDNETISKKSINHYTSILEVFSRSALGDEGKQYIEMKKDLEHKAIQIQKASLQKMYEEHEITHSTATTLRKYIRFAELALLAGEL